MVYLDWSCYIYPISYSSGQRFASCYNCGSYSEITSGYAFRPDGHYFVLAERHKSKDTLGVYDATDAYKLVQVSALFQCTTGLLNTHSIFPCRLRHSLRLLFLRRGIMLLSGRDPSKLALPYLVLSPQPKLLLV